MRIGGTRVWLAAIGLGVLAVFSVPALAAQPGLAVTSTVDGRSLQDAGANSPIALRPSDSTLVKVAVTNNGSKPVEIRAVRLNARVLGLAFFSYTTRVDLTVASGATGTRTFVLDLGDLDGQATGLLPAELALLAPDRSVLASEKGTVDVRGKITSVYGVFGIAVAAITAVLLLGLIGRLVRRTLPDSRWSRALRFAVPGLGLGLTTTFTLGVLRILVPSLATSIGLLIGGLVVGFVLGYLTPAPSDEADRDALDERDIVTPAPTVRVPPQMSPMQPHVPESRVPAAGFGGGPAPGSAPAFGAGPAVPAQPVRPSNPDADDDGRQTRLVGPPAPPTA